MTIFVKIPNHSISILRGILIVLHCNKTSPPSPPTIDFNLSVFPYKHMNGLRGRLQAKQQIIVILSCRKYDGRFFFAVTDFTTYV